MWNAWTQPAKQLASAAAWIRNMKLRGAIPVQIEHEVPSVPPASDPLVFGIFSSDQIVTDVRGQLMVEFVRRELNRADFEELAFGFSEDLGSWAMLIAAAHKYRTEAGRALHRELLLLDLEDILGKARRTVYDFAEAPVAEWSA